MPGFWDERRRRPAITRPAALMDAAIALRADEAAAGIARQLEATPEQAAEIRRLVNAWARERFPTRRARLAFLRYVDAGLSDPGAGERVRR